MQENTKEVTAPLESDSSVRAVDSLIRWIKKKKLETPATLFLEMHRPLMPLAHPVAILVGPFIAPFFGPEYYDRIKSLSDPKTLDRLLARISDRELTDPQKVDIPDGRS